MNVLCAIGIQGGPEVVQRVVRALGSGQALHLLHVIDAGPRHTLEAFLRGPGPRRRARPPPPPGRAQPIDRAEEEAGAAALEEARREAERAGVHFSAQVERGRPEQIIVRIAQERRCDLTAIQANEGAEGRPRLGPDSVGHTARFVLDHAPCDVFLLRAPVSVP